VLIVTRLYRKRMRVLVIIAIVAVKASVCAWGMVTVVLRLRKLLH